MRIVGVDHVQLAMPAGEEDKARAFYAGLLELIEYGQLPGAKAFDKDPN